MCSLYESSSILCRELIHAILDGTVSVFDENDEEDTDNEADEEGAPAPPLQPDEEENYPDEESVLTHSPPRDLPASRTST